MNLSGTALLTLGSETVTLRPGSRICLLADHIDEAARPRSESHRFISFKLTRDFLAQFCSGSEHRLQPVLRAYLHNEPANPAIVGRTDGQSDALFRELARPPVPRHAQPLWFRSKLLELAAELFFEPEHEEMFCHRQQKVANERVEAVKSQLLGNLANPPSLDELGKAIGCSPHYLSRTFSKEVGMTITQFVRKARIAKAAELLRSGKFNVTETALEVGYNSLSHFSKIFYEETGCCPGLYPNDLIFGKDQRKGRSG